MESIYGESIGVVTFDLGDLERPMSRSLNFLKLIISK